MDDFENSLSRLGDDHLDSAYKEVQQPIESAIDPRLFDSSYLTLDPGSENLDVETFNQDVPFNTASMSIGQRRLLQEQVDLSGSDDESDDLNDYDPDDDGLWNGGIEG